MNCPVCNVVLAAHERQGVEIDMCPKCRGLWLGRGELDKLVERAESRPLPPRYDDDDDDEDRYDRSRHRRGEEHPRQRRSWWGELFD